MSKELQLFNGEAVPAHIRKRMAQLPQNIEDRATVPSLVMLGKGTWAIVLNGETTRLQKRDSEGDLVDMPVFRGIILDFAKRRGRTYYPGAYDPDKPGKPKCWSDDGITVSSHVPVDDLPVTEDGEIIRKCANCPFSEKGSKINELGNPVAACGEHRLIALVPSNKPDFTPLRLKLSITSDFDGKSPELEAEDWYAFSNYKDMLRKRGVTNTAVVITKIRFDPNKKFPKLIFQWGGWVDEQWEDHIAKTIESDGVKSLLVWGTGDAEPTPDAYAKPKTTAKAANDDAPKVTKRPPPPADDPPAKPKKTVVPKDDDDEGPQSKPFTDDDVVLTTTAKADKAATAAKLAAKKKAAEDDDGDVTLPTPGKKKAAEATAPKKEPVAVGPDMTALMGKWDTEEDE